MENIGPQYSYFYNWRENKIMMYYIYNSDMRRWAIPLKYPNRDFSIAVVNGLLTAIEGKQSSDSKDTPQPHNIKNNVWPHRTTEVD